MNLFKKDTKIKNAIEQSKEIVQIKDVPTDPTNPELMLEKVIQAASESQNNSKQKSVIGHLLSQVKIGMDLTKITLPAHVLENRSLLEFYADIFSYPELFLDIAKQQDPEQRMIACLRFYVSSFSAARKNNSCKKPYNPILGEYFRCFYNTGAEKSSSKLNLDEDDSNKDPLHWASDDNTLKFIAEQVSHHPPVSACYAVNHDHNIVYEGHAWTKSKFNGLSVSIDMVGPGVIRLSDKKEDYEFTYPSVAVRSILTYPWVEMIGETSILCAKTNLKAKIKFHPKPFYKGSLNRITAEVTNQTTKQVVCALEGNWDGTVFVKYPHKNQKEVFFKKSSMQSTPKRVRRLPKQSKVESRRLWYEVTESLSDSRLEEASKFKGKLEFKQREDAKERKLKQVQYKPAYFKKNEKSNWVYVYREKE